MGDSFYWQSAHLTQTALETSIILMAQVKSPTPLKKEKEKKENERKKKLKKNKGSRTFDLGHSYIGWS